MASQVVPFTKNREFIYDLLTRAKRFHCSVTGTFDFDLTETLERLDTQRQQGRAVSLTSVLVKTTSKLLEKHPRMNHHLFHGLFRKKEVAFDHITCTLVVERTSPSGESILFPVLLEHSNRMPLEEIHGIIRYHKEEDLDKLPQMAALERIKRLPRLLIKYFSYKARSDPAFYEKYFGTYGLSSLAGRGWGAHGGSVLSNVCSAFFPAAIQDKAVVVGSEIAIRRMLTLGFVADHYLLDGMEIMRAMQDLRAMLEQGEVLE